MTASGGPKALPLQTQSLGSAGDQPWVSLSVTQLSALHLSGPTSLWIAPLTLPADRGSRPFPPNPVG